MLRSQAVIVSKKTTVLLFTIEKSQFQNLTLQYNRSRSTQGHHFEQTMMGWSSRCYIPSFVEIGQMVLEKKIFEGFLTCMGMAAILVM